jgi:hypothetical protein
MHRFQTLLSISTCGGTPRRLSRRRTSRRCLWPSWGPSRCGPWPVRPTPPPSTRPTSSQPHCRFRVPRRQAAPTRPPRQGRSDVARHVIVHRHALQTFVGGVEGHPMTWVAACGRVAVRTGGGHTGAGRHRCGGHVAAGHATQGAVTHVIPCQFSRHRGFRMRVDDVAANGSDRCCSPSPRHRMPYESRHEGSNFLWGGDDVAGNVWRGPRSRCGAHFHCPWRVTARATKPWQGGG